MKQSDENKDLPNSPALDNVAEHVTGNPDAIIEQADDAFGQSLATAIELNANKLKLQDENSGHATFVQQEQIRRKKAGWCILM